MEVYVGKGIMNGGVHQWRAEMIGRDDWFISYLVVVRHHIHHQNPHTFSIDWTNQKPLVPKLDLIPTPSSDQLWLPSSVPTILLSNGVWEHSKLSMVRSSSSLFFNRFLCFFVTPGTGTSRKRWLNNFLVGNRHEKVFDKALEEGNVHIKLRGSEPFFVNGDTSVLEGSSNQDLLSHDGSKI